MWNQFVVELNYEVGFHQKRLTTFVETLLSKDQLLESIEAQKQNKMRTVEIGDKGFSLLYFKLPTVILTVDEWKEKELKFNYEDSGYGL